MGRHALSDGGGGGVVVGGGGGGVRTGLEQILI